MLSCIIGWMVLPFTEIRNTKSELGCIELGWIEILNSTSDTENLGYF